MNDKNISRLRKGGMVRAAIAMATVAVAAAAPMTASATIVYLDGGQTNAAGNVTIAIGNVPIFDLIQNTGKGTAATIGNYQNFFGYIGTPTPRRPLNDITKLTEGDTVDSFDNYLKSGVACFNVTGNGYCGEFAPGTSGYFGFEYSPDDGNTINYGWAEVAVGANGSTLTLLRGAYDDSGAGITVRPAGVVTTAAVPEPATWAMMVAGFGMVGGAMRSRRRHSASMAVTAA